MDKHRFLPVRRYSALGLADSDNDSGTTPALVDNTDKAMTFTLTDGTENTSTTQSPLSPEQWVQFSFSFTDANNAQATHYLATYWGSLGQVYVWSYSDTAPWEVFAASEVLNPETVLKDLVTTYAEETTEYATGGTDPGNFDSTAVAAYQAALTEAQRFVSGDHSEAEWLAMYNKLHDARTALESSMVQITDGYYYIVNAFDEFFIQQNVYKAMYSNGTGTLKWGDIDEKNAAYIFNIKKQEDGTFSVQNYGDESYISGAAGTSTDVPTTKKFVTPQTFKLLGGAQFNMANTTNKMAYHTSGHNGGAGKGGNVVTWNGGMNTASAWKLRKINDQAFIDSLAAAKVQLEIDKQLLALVDQAQEIYDANFVYTPDTGSPMITDANDTGTGQVSSNAKEPSEGSFSALIDKTSAGTPDYSTYFHSQWTAGAPAADHYLQVDISAFQKAKPTSMFNFTWSRRIQNNSNRPTKMTIYATNDTTAGGTWKAIQTIATGWPTKTTDTTYVSNGIVMDQPYKYLRFVVNATNTGAAKNGHVFFSCSNFQIYPVSLDQERSQYITSPGMKEAVDALGALIRSDKEKAANHQSKTSDFDELNAAMNAVKALFADTTEYVALRQKAQDYVNGAVVGTDFGQLSDASLATSLQSLINQQKATLNLAIPKTAEITAAMAALQEKIDAFLAGIKTIEPGKWYYIINAGQKASYAYGQAMMLNGKSTGDATQFGGLVDDNPLYETNPYAMWRFVPIEGSKYYGLQNLGTGHFMGKYRGWGGKLYPEAVTTADPYEVRYMGQGQMAIYSVDSTNTYDCYLNAQRTNSRIVNWPFTANSGTSWTFKEVSATEFSFDVRNKSVQIACFPFDLGDSENTLSSANPSVKTYAVKNLTSDGTNTTVDLTVLEGVIPAGTPFVLEVNDSEADTVTTIVAPAKFDITTSAREANGIVGTLDGIQLSKAGYGYLAGDTLRTTVDTLITIAGGSGYFTPEGLVAGTGETAKQLTAEGLINAIRNISASKGSLRVNVYTVDGKLLRSGVATDEARKGLSKGIYIIGRKKVAVK